MSLTTFLLLLTTVLASSGCRPADLSPHRSDLPQLKLMAAYPVEAPHPLEPSGLTLIGDTLFTVADKVDDTLYRIEFDEGLATLRPHLRFDPPEKSRLDWEGVTTDHEGNFYLISERFGRLLRLRPDGTAAWASPDLRPEGHDLGLFAKSNAGFEGVTWLGPDHWLGAAERDQRGLVEWRLVGGVLSVESSLHMDSPFKDALPLLRLPDYAGLCAGPDGIFALFRNAHLVVELDKREGRWQEIAAWSYAHLETDPALAYVAQAYGQAEGLAVRGQDVYIIFDNNLGPRKADRSDRRPLLIHARFPASPD